MRIGKSLIAGLAGGLMVVGAAHNASANSITVTINTPVVTALGDGTYEWAYGATLSAGSEIQQGNFFEIVDFGTVLGVTPNSNWSYTTQAHSQVTGSDIQLAFNNL